MLVVNLIITLENWLQRKKMIYITCNGLERLFMSFEKVVVLQEAILMMIIQENSIERKKMAYFFTLGVLQGELKIEQRSDKWKRRCNCEMTLPT